MQSPPRFSLLRRILFPYSGEDPLTRQQGMRVILIWAFLFACLMLVCTFPFILAAAPFSLSKMVEFLLVSFLTGFVVFGLLAWVLVGMNNRAGRIRQEQKITSDDTNGGRYGS